MRSLEIFLELWLLRYQAKGRNEQNVVGDGNSNNSIQKIISETTTARYIDFLR
jgi:hypothetical protein